MIVDENLKDCSHELLESYRKQLALRNLAYMISIISSFLLIMLAGKFKYISNQNQVLITEIEQDEQILTLEYSIGYYFINTPNEINDDVLYNFLIENGAWYPEILLKQAKLESGNYTSDVYKNSCNLYGMKKVGKRQTTQRGTYNGYGVYDNWCLSVLDRMLWDIFRFNNTKPTEEEYLKALEQYAETPDYVNYLKL